MLRWLKDRATGKGRKKRTLANQWPCLLLLLVVLVAGRSVGQPIRTAEAEAATRTRVPVLEIVLCKDVDEPKSYKFTVYDHRVLPPQRVLPKYVLIGKGKKQGKLSSKNDPCPGGGGTPVFTSDVLDVEPAHDSAEGDHLWWVRLRLTNGGQVHLVPLIREDAPSKTTILYHPETKRYCIGGWEKDCAVPGVGVASEEVEEAPEDGEEAPP